MHTFILKITFLIAILVVTSCAKDEHLSTVRVTKIETSKETESSFNRIERLNSSEYIASTYDGTFFLSTDKGETWTVLPKSPFQGHYLKEFHFSTRDTGFAVGIEDDFSNGVLYKTTDQGLTWNTGLFATNKDIISVAFVNGNDGFCLTSQSTYWTSDGGDRWPQIEPDSYADKIYALNKDTAITISNLDFSYFMTFDGGENWSEDEAYSGYLNKGAKLFYLDGDLYGVNQAGKVLKSPNKGKSWPNIANMSDNCDFPMYGLDIRERYGIAVGFNAILISVDGGDSWDFKLTQDGENFPGALLSVKMISEKTGIAVAHGMGLYKIEIED